MKRSQFFRYLLILCCLAGALQTSQAVGQEPDGAGLNIPQNSTIIVVLHPQTLLGENGIGLLESWQPINEPFGKRYIQAQPHSTIHYSLQPAHSFDGAVLQLVMNGTSIGATTTVTGGQRVVTNNVTQFVASQTVFLNRGGISFSPPVLDLQSNQSFHQASRTRRSTKTNDGSLANSIARTGFKLFEERLNTESTAFSRQQVQRQILVRNQRTSRRFNQFRAEFNQENPKFGALSWQFSSDDHHLYIHTGTHLISTAPPNVNDPLTFLITAETINRWLAGSLANQELDANNIAEKFGEIVNPIKTTDVDKSKNNEDWTVQLGDDPINIELHENSIRGVLSADEYSSGKRSLKGMSVIFELRIQRDAEGWFLARDEDVQVESKDPDQRLGARQQILRTVMRKRLNDVFPKRIDIPTFDSFEFTSELGIELELVRVNATNDWLAIGFRPK